MLFLSSCNSTQVTVQPPIEKTRSLSIDKTSENSTPTEEVQVQNTIEVEVTEEVPTPTMEATPTEKIEPTPEMEFDTNVLNMTDWSSYHLLEKEILEKPANVTLLEGTRLYSLPIFEDYFYDSPMISEITLNKPIELQISEKREITNDKGEVVQVGIVSNSYSISPYGGALVAIINATDSNGTEKTFYKKSNDLQTENSVVSTQVFDLLRENDLQSTLLSIERLMKFQEENGGFIPGQTYKIKDILYPLEDFYELASNPGLQGRILTTGWDDLCSGISLFLNKNSEVGQVTNFVFNEAKYSSHLFELENQWDPTLTFNNPTFEFEVYQQGYFKIDIVLLPRGPEADTIDFPAGISDDATKDVIYTLTFVPSQDVEKQSDIFMHDSENQTIQLPDSYNSISIRHYYKETRVQTEMMKAIFNTLRISDFE